MTTVLQSQFKVDSAKLLDVYGTCRLAVAGQRQDLVLPEIPESGEWLHPVTGASATLEVHGDLAASPYADAPSTGGAFALVVTRPVPEQGLAWSLEVVGDSEADQSSLVTVGVSRKSLTGLMPRLDRAEVKPPRVIADLISRFGSPSIPALPKEIRQTSDIPSFLNAATSSARWFPLVAVSEHNWTRQSPVDAAVLSRRMAGVAVVVRITKEASFAFAQQLQSLGLDPLRARRWAVYNGAVRVYLPDCDFFGQSPFEHPLFLPDDAKRPDFADELVQWCYDLSVLAPLRRPVRDHAALRLVGRS